MKCILVYKTSPSVIKRVTDDEARAEVKAGRAMFVPKREWKIMVKTNAVKTAVDAGEMTPALAKVEVTAIKAKANNRSKARAG